MVKLWYLPYMVCQCHFLCLKTWNILLRTAGLLSHIRTSGQNQESRQCCVLIKTTCGPPLVQAPSRLTMFRWGPRWAKTFSSAIRLWTEPVLAAKTQIYSFTQVLSQIQDWRQKESYVWPSSLLLYSLNQDESNQTLLPQQHAQMDQNPTPDLETDTQVRLQTSGYLVIPETHNNKKHMKFPRTIRSSCTILRVLLVLLYFYIVLRGLVVVLPSTTWSRGISQVEL